MSSMISSSCNTVSEAIVSTCKAARQGAVTGRNYGTFVGFAVGLEMFQRQNDGRYPDFYDGGEDCRGWSGLFNSIYCHNHVAPVIGAFAGRFIGAVAGGVAATCYHVGQGIFNKLCS